LVGPQARADHDDRPRAPAVVPVDDQTVDRLVPEAVTRDHQRTRHEKGAAHDGVVLQVEWPGVVQHLVEGPHQDERPRVECVPPDTLAVDETLWMSIDTSHLLAAPIAACGSHSPPVDGTVELYDANATPLPAKTPPEVHLGGSRPRESKTVASAPKAIFDCDTRCLEARLEQRVMVERHDIQPPDGLIATRAEQTPVCFGELLGDTSTRLVARNEGRADDPGDVVNRFGHELGQLPRAGPGVIRTSVQRGRLALTLLDERLQQRVLEFPGECIVDLLAREVEAFVVQVLLSKALLQPLQEANDPLHVRSPERERLVGNR